MTPKKLGTRNPNLLVAGLALLMALSACGRSKPTGAGPVNFRGGGGNSGGDSSGANGGGGNAPALEVNLVSLNNSQPVTTFGWFMGDTDDVVHDAAHTTEVAMEFQCNIDCKYDSVSVDTGNLVVHSDQYVQVAGNRFRVIGHWVAADSKNRTATVKLVAGSQSASVPVTFSHTVKMMARKTIYRASNAYDWRLTDVYGEGANGGDPTNGYNYNWSRAFEVFAEPFKTDKVTAQRKLVRCYFQTGDGRFHFLEQGDGCDPTHGVPLSKELGYVPSSAADVHIGLYPGMVALYRAIHMAWNGSTWVYDSIRYTAPLSTVEWLATQGGDPGWREEGPLGLSVIP